MTNWIWIKYTWEWIGKHIDTLSMLCGLILLVLVSKNLYEIGSNRYGLLLIFLMLCGIHSIATFAYNRGENKNDDLFDYYKLSYDRNQTHINSLQEELVRYKEESKYINTLHHPIDEEELINEIDKLTGE